MKGTKHQRTERYDFKGVETNAKYQVYYICIIKTANEIKDIKTKQEQDFFNDCVIIKLIKKKIIFNIFNHLCKY